MEVKYYTPICLTVSPLQNGFSLAHGPSFFGFLAKTFDFFLVYPLYIQPFPAINYIYTTIITIRLYYTITISYIYTIIYTISYIYSNTT